MRRVHRNLGEGFYSFSGPFEKGKIDGEEDAEAMDASYAVLKRKLHNIEHNLAKQFLGSKEKADRSYEGGYAAGFKSVTDGQGDREARSRYRAQNNPRLRRQRFSNPRRPDDDYGKGYREGEAEAQRVIANVAPENLAEAIWHRGHAAGKGGFPEYGRGSSDGFFEAIRRHPLTVL